MNYEQTIGYLYEQLPMFSRIGVAAYKKDLGNTLALCRHLGDPHRKFRCIHVAGTNGKGSTSHMLAAILQQAGYKTGLYTSPHIRDFRERIRINGKMIDKDLVVDFVKRTFVITEEIKPSFFELTVAMAFEHFANEQVDIAVIETGLGGRLDSTNVISPVLSIITNIGYDHVNLLGNTLAEIAGEKAGIIKLNTPALIGETMPETLPVFVSRASAMNAPVHYAADLYACVNSRYQDSMLQLNLLNKSTGNHEIYELDLPGLYQEKNTCTALSAVDLLNDQGFNISKAAVREALARVKSTTGLAGRWDIIQNSPDIILDVGHNADGIKLLLQQLENDYPDSGYHFVLGFVSDKDINHILGLFPKNANYYFTNAHIPRALPYHSLQEIAREKHLTGNGYDDVDEAISAAKKNSAQNDVILVCGSFFIIAEVSC